MCKHRSFYSQLHGPCQSKRIRQTATRQVAYSLFYHTRELICSSQ